MVEVASAILVVGMLLMAHVAWVDRKDRRARGLAIRRASSPSPLVFRIAQNPPTAADLSESPRRRRSIVATTI